MRIAIVLVFLVLLSHFAYADEISFRAFRDDFSPGETVQLEASINAKPEFQMEAGDIKLKSSSESIRIAPFLNKLNDTLYFISFDIPQGISDGNYSVVIENLLFKENGKLVQKDQKYILNIAYSEPALSISPAFFVSSQQLNLEVFGRKNSTDVTIEAPWQLKHVYSSPQSIQEGKSRLFKFALQDYNFTQLSIGLSYDGKSYSVPVYNLNQESIVSPSANASSQAVQSSMRFSAPQPSIDRSIEKDAILQGPISLSNSGSSGISSIILSLTGNLAGIVSVYPGEIPLLKANESVDIILSINKEQNPSSESYSGDLKAVSGSLSASYPISIKILQDEAKQENSRQPETAANQPSSEETDLPGYNILNLSGSYEEKKPSKVSSSFIITLLTLLAGIVIYIFSRKKVEHKPFEALLNKR